MSSDFSHLVRCLDLSEEDVADAVESRESTRALIGRLAACSAPNTGAAKALLVFARMATTACDWIDGDLQIELVGDDELTVVEVMTELGGGLRERLFAPMSFHSPLLEFARAIERVPHLIAPLAVRGKSARRITLSASANVRRTTVPPPPIEISVESLYVPMPAPGVPRNDDVPSLPLLASDPALEIAPELEPAPEPALSVEPSPPAAPAPPQTSTRPPGETRVGDVDRGWDD